jgi:hypothetical protein
MKMAQFVDDIGAAGYSGLVKSQERANLRSYSKVVFPDPGAPLYQSKFMVDDPSSHSQNLGVLKIQLAVPGVLLDRIS